MKYNLCFMQINFYFYDLFWEIHFFIFQGHVYLFVIISDHSLTIFFVLIFLY